MHRSVLPLVLSGVASLLLATVARATIVVDPGGGGDFTTLEAAISAATDGEQILIKSGTYVPASGVTFTIDGKGLSLVAEAGADVRLAGLTVTGLPEGHWVIARGLTLDATLAPFISFGPGTVLVEGPAGSVWLEDCTILGRKGQIISGLGPIVYHARPAVEVGKGGSVTLQRCTATGGEGHDAYVLFADKFTADRGTPAVGVHDGRAAILDSTLTGGNGGDGDVLFMQPVFWAQDGGPGLYVKDTSFAHVAGSHLTGGDNGDNQATDWDSAGDAVLVEFGLAHVWLRDNVLVPGQVVGEGMPGLPVDAFPVSVTELGAPARSLHVTSPLREGQLGTLTVQGVPGDQVVLLVALGAGTSPMLAKQGVFTLDPSVLLLPVALGAIDASGTLALPFVTPDLNPALGGLTVPMQLAVLNGGVVTLEAGTALAWLDASL